MKFMGGNVIVNLKYAMVRIWSLWVRVPICYLSVTFSGSQEWLTDMNKLKAWGPGAQGEGLATGEGDLLGIKKSGFKIWNPKNHRCVLLLSHYCIIICYHLFSKIGILESASFRDKTYVNIVGRFNILQLCSLCPDGAWFNLRFSTILHPRNPSKAYTY